MAYSITVSLTVAIVVSALTPLLLTRFPEANLNAISVEVDQVSLAFGRHDPHFRVAQKKEYAFIDSIVNADFSPLFHWNTKQLYLGLVLSFDNNNYKHNNIVIWDDILEDKSDGIFNNMRIQNKYAVTDIDSRGFRNLNATLSFNWEIVPYFGLLEYGKSKS